MRTIVFGVAVVLTESAVWRRSDSDTLHALRVSVACFNSLDPESRVFPWHSSVFGSSAPKYRELALEARADANRVANRLGVDLTILDEEDPIPLSEYIRSQTYRSCMKNLEFLRTFKSEMPRSNFGLSHLEILARDSCFSREAIFEKEALCRQLLYTSDFP